MRDKAIQMRKEGKPYGEIAKELKRSENTIKSWVRRHKMKAKGYINPLTKKLREEIKIKKGYEQRIKILEREVELLRDFLYELERRDVKK